MIQVFDRYGNLKVIGSSAGNVGNLQQVLENGSQGAVQTPILIQRNDNNNNLLGKIEFSDSFNGIKYIGGNLDFINVDEDDNIRSGIRASSVGNKLYLYGNIVDGNDNSFVKSVSVNGGTPTFADINGNVDITVSGGGGDYVPYTGANNNVNLGDYNLSTKEVYIYSSFGTIDDKVRIYFNYDDFSGTSNFRIPIGDGTAVTRLTVNGVEYTPNTNGNILFDTPSTEGFVPYEGAFQNVNLGNYNIYGGGTSTSEAWKLYYVSDAGGTLRLAYDANNSTTFQGSNVFITRNSENNTFTFPLFSAGEQRYLPVSVSINGGTPVISDSSGNIDVPLPSGIVQSVTGTLVDNTDPANPIINIPNLNSVANQGSTVFAPFAYSWYTLGNPYLISCSNFSVQTGSGELSLQGGGTSIFAQTENNALVITGLVPSTYQGIKYADNYAANYTNRSLVDKQYVDTAIASVGTGTVTSVAATGNNGIGISGSPITSAGTLVFTLGAITPTSISTGTGNFTGDVQIPSTPVNANSAVSWGYVQGMVYGLNWKYSVRATTTSALPSYTVSGDFKTLTASVNGSLPSQDGIALSVGERVLVKNEIGSNRTNNGGYVVTSVGSASTPWVLTRMAGSDTSSYLEAATYYVREGSTEANRTYAVNSNPVTLGTTQITFALISGTGTYTNGTGILLSGNVFSIDNTYITTATQTALNLKANLASPALTGTPTAPTAAANTNNTQIATTAYADAKVQNSLAASTTIAPSASAVNNALANKQDLLVSGTNIKTVGGQSLLGSGNVTQIQTDFTSSNTLAPSVDAIVTYLQANYAQLAAMNTFTAQQTISANLVIGNNSNIQNSTSLRFNLNVGSASTPATITRNTADAISAFAINNQNASNTGQIVEFQSGGVTVASVLKSGIIRAASAVGSNDVVIKSQLDAITPYTATATLDFPSTNSQSSSDLTISVPGAVVGKPVSLGVPPSSVLSNSSYSAWVSAADTVTVRFNNYYSVAQNPPSGSFTVNVSK